MRRRGVLLSVLFSFHPPTTHPFLYIQRNLVPFILLLVALSQFPYTLPPFLTAPTPIPHLPSPQKKFERGFWVSRGGGRRPHRTQVARHIIPSSPRTLKRARTYFSHPQKREAPKKERKTEDGSNVRKRRKEEDEEKRKKANESTLRKNLTKKRGRKRRKRRGRSLLGQTLSSQKKTPGFQIRGCRRQKLEGKYFFLERERKIIY